MSNFALRSFSALVMVAAIASFAACDSSEGDGAGGASSSTGDAPQSSSSSGEGGSTNSSSGVGCSVGTAGPRVLVCIAPPGDATGTGAGGAGEGAGGGGPGGSPGTGSARGGAGGAGGTGGAAAVDECPPVEAVRDLLDAENPDVSVSPSEEPQLIGGECCYGGWGQHCDGA